ncbi:hypothetical protein CWC11_19715 [Pseudoalteromonas sp. S3178]|uniref:hypothetical protein n=1 Tax=Pseudoalteromonas sp. S3178 TaxID=579532 RepID=UPI00110BDAB5|nr:hypothetical protein [Pseudoalteromonas sp. S3178]TMP02100.1 hypothetical protein CWC11_19715 [Pseudoalteromonas sp. S3178]
MNIRIIILFCIFAVCGCAYTPKQSSEIYKKNVQNHILRVSNHGYLIKDGVVLNRGLKNTSNMHLTLTETAKKYSNMLYGAFELACENNDTLSTLSQKTEYKKITRKLMDDMAQCSVNQLLKFCNYKLFNDFESFFVTRSIPIKLLFYFHGGLNSHDDSDARMESQVEFIKKGLSKGRYDANDLPSTEYWQYPIYVSWPSSALSAYGEHLFDLREGRRVAPSLSYFSSPIILIEDLVTSIGELPMNVYYQFTNDKDRLASKSGNWLSHVWLEADKQFKSLKCTRKDASLPYEFAVKEVLLDEKYDAAIRLNRSVYNRNSLRHKFKSGIFIVATPVRYVLGSLWNGTIAGNSWKVMKRRARNMFDPTGDADNRLQNSDLSLYKDGIGSSLGSLFESLFALKKRYPELDLQLNLVGHSMGTIAINNLLQKYELDWKTSGILKNVVYMAAAASTQETLAIVPKLMMSEKSFDFFNLTLNRVSEVAEFYAFGFAPSGSLLVSIDKYHDEPEHHLKRTFGSEINVRSSLPTILKSFKGARGNVVLKAFNDIEAFEKSIKIPVKHGDFGKLDFWLPSTWEITNEKYEIPTLDQSYHCEPRLERPYVKDNIEVLYQKGKATDVLFKN